MRDSDSVTLIAARECAAVAPDKTFCLELWGRARGGNDSLVDAILSNCLVRTVVGPVAESVRLWLLVNPSSDPATTINVLSGLQIAIVERDKVADFQMSVLGAFLLHCLTNDAPVVRVSVLDFLRDYLLVSKKPPRRLGRAIAGQLANALRERLEAVVEDEEIAELKRVTASLRSKDIPISPPISLDAIEEPRR